MKIPTLVLACFLLGAAPPERASLDELAWLAGAWRSETSSGWTEERWAPPRGGVMLGTSLSGQGDKATFFEYMRIAADASGVISFWGAPNGQPAVPFRLVSASRYALVFEDPQHDFPTRIAYRRSAKRLVATVSGPGGSGAQSWSFQHVAR